MTSHEATAEATSGLPTDLHNAGAHSHHGENRSPTLRLSDAVVASTITAVQRPVRFLTDRLDHCCNHSSTQHLLSNESYVIVISLDFSKAFDTVRHSQLLQNWLNATFRTICTTSWQIFNNHSHCTVFRGELSALLSVTASIIQGSSHWTCCVRRHCWRPRRRRAGKLAVQICRRHVRHHPCQQRGVAARGTRQRAEMGRTEQPETELQ